MGEGHYCSVVPDLVGEPRADCACKFPFGSTPEGECNVVAGSLYCHEDYSTCAPNSVCNYTLDDNGVFDFFCTCPPGQSQLLVLRKHSYMYMTPFIY